MLRKMWEHGNNRAADDQPLNPQLYQAVTEITGMEPRIKDPGVRRVVGRNGEPQWGEQYQANCPLCGDNRGRFLISYAFGTPDPRNLRPILNAWHCFNEKCHQSEINQYRLYQLLRQAGYRSRQVNRAVGRLQPQPADRPILIMPPDGLAPINRLPRSHSAVDYLVARGFDVDELWARWGVAFCADGVNLQPVVSNRIFIPIYGVADSSQYKSDAAVQLKLLGWQARVIGEAAGRGPKYLTMKGFEKSKTLYGLPNALVGNGPVVICEGVADCWKVGSGAVAILGKSLSRRQVELIVEYFSGRPIVVLLDSDAREEAAAIVRQLSSC